MRVASKLADNCSRLAGDLLKGLSKVRSSYFEGFVKNLSSLRSRLAQDPFRGLAPKLLRNLYEDSLEVLLNELEDLRKAWHQTRWKDNLLER